MHLSEAFGVSILSSSSFVDINSTESIVVASSLDLYDILFEQCNYQTSILCISFASEANIINIVSIKSAGIAASQENVYLNAVSLCVFKSIYPRFMQFGTTPINISHVNFSHCSSEILFASWVGAPYLSTKYMSFVSNICQSICANLETGTEMKCINKRHQYVRNKCSQSLLSSYRTNCYCYWFYFIDNDNTLLVHDSGRLFIFTSSSCTKKLEGPYSGEISVLAQLTQPPIPIVLKRLCSKKTKILIGKSILMISIF